VRLQAPVEVKGVLLIGLRTRSEKKKLKVRTLGHEEGSVVVTRYFLGKSPHLWHRESIGSAYWRTFQLDDGECQIRCCYMCEHYSPAPGPPVMVVDAVA